MPGIHQIALVGHCGFDAASLRRFVQRQAPQATVVELHDRAALDQAGPDTLLLVNRVLDGDLNAADGVDLIRQVRLRDNAPRAMLISNYEQAQREAEAVGALPGFGKAQIGSAEAARRLQEAMR